MVYFLQPAAVSANWSPKLPNDCCFVLFFTLRLVILFISLSKTLDTTFSDKKLCEGTQYFQTGHHSVQIYWLLLHHIKLFEALKDVMSMCPLRWTNPYHCLGLEWVRWEGQGTAGLRSLLHIRERDGSREHYHRLAV